jgi:hypothetical protein
MHYQFNLSKGVPRLSPHRHDAIAKYDAVRDDLAIAAQLGWSPPRPSYMVRMLLARRGYRKPPTQET